MDEKSLSGQSMSSTKFVMRFRDTINEMIDKRVAMLRPKHRDAWIRSVDYNAGKATVQYVDEPEGDHVEVRMGAVRPVVQYLEYGLDYKVRIEGIGGDRFMSAIYGPAKLNENYIEPWTFTVDVPMQDSGDTVVVNDLITAEGFTIEDGMYVVHAYVDFDFPTSATDVTGGRCSADLTGGRTSAGSGVAVPFGITEGLWQEEDKGGWYTPDECDYPSGIHLSETYDMIEGRNISLRGDALVRRLTDPGMPLDGGLPSTSIESRGWSARVSISKISGNLNCEVI